MSDIPFGYSLYIKHCFHNKQYDTNNSSHLVYTAIYLLIIFNKSEIF